MHKPLLFLNLFLRSLRSRIILSVILIEIWQKHAKKMTSTVNTFTIQLHFFKAYKVLNVMMLVIFCACYCHRENLVFGALKSIDSRVSPPPHNPLPPAMDLLVHVNVCLHCIQS